MFPLYETSLRTKSNDGIEPLQFPHLLSSTIEACCHQQQGRTRLLARSRDLVFQTTTTARSMQHGRRSGATTRSGLMPWRCRKIRGPSKILRRLSRCRHISPVSNTLVDSIQSRPEKESHLFSPKVVDNSSRIAGYRQPNAVSAVFFDDRLNPHQIDVCNFASMPLISAPAQYSITTTAMRVLDKHNLTNWAAGRPACNRTVYDIFYNRSKPLSLYSLSVDSSTVYTDCEAQDADGDGTNKCQFFAEFSLGSQLVQSSHSAPGATKLSIVVNAGAIVGGVQFLMWFLEKLGG